MSYKFNLDHTLAIADIHDMITIDIKPETRCSVTGGDVEIHGYLTFRGSYLTPELGEAPFEGSVPLDITLPYLGGVPDIRPEVVAFDYLVDNKKSLTLNLEIALKGYVVADDKDVVLDAWVEPIVDEPVYEEVVYEEAVIEPFDFSTPSTEEIVMQASEVQTPQMLEEAYPFYQEAVPIFEDEPFIQEEIVVRVEPSVTETEELVMEVVPQEEEVFEEEIPYSPLIDLEERTVDIEAVEFEHYEVPEPTSEPVAEVEIPQAPVQEAPISEEVFEEIEVPLEREKPKMSDSAMALMDELFAMKRGKAFKEQMLEPGLSQAEVEIEPVLEPEKLADTQVVDSEEMSADSVENVPVEANVHSDNSVARQFADGETTIKMVYVEEETDTLGGVLERYMATLDDVWNLSELADGVSIGDCVMLRYEKTE